MMTAYPYLELDQLRIDPRVMKLLPPDLAYHYHALPIATDGNQITVALASPEDREALDAVQSALEAPVCIIRADSEEIDQRINQLWPKNPIRKKILIISSESDTPSFLMAAKTFCETMDGELDHIYLSQSGKEGVNQFTCAIESSIPDLLIIQACHPNRLTELFPNPVVQRQLELVPASLIFPTDPLSPIQKILLILPDNRAGGELAIHWVVKLASTYRAEVTVLPILPSVPICYGSYLNHSIDSLLEGNHPLGKKMRSIVEQFSGENIQGNYKLRDGDPLYQIQDEIFSSDPDLIIMPSIPNRGPARWLSIDLVKTLFMCITTPILITK